MPILLQEAMSLACNLTWLISRQSMFQTMNLPTHSNWDKMADILLTTSDLFSSMKTSMKIVFLSQIYRSLFLRVQFTINQHLMRQWCGTEQVTSPYLNQHWVSLLMHTRVTRPYWVKRKFIKLFAQFSWFPFWIIFGIPMKHSEEDQYVSLVAYYCPLTPLLFMDMIVYATKTLFWYE